MYERITANKWRTFAPVPGLGRAARRPRLRVRRADRPRLIGRDRLALILAGVLSITSFRFGDKLVLAAARAKRVTREEEPRLHNLVEGLCIAAGLDTVPALYVVPEDAPNAFATGPRPRSTPRSRSPAGLLNQLNRVELEGVLAHELSHVTNRDILVGTIAATLAGAVVLMSEIFLRWLWWGGGRRGGGDGAAEGSRCWPSSGSCSPCWPPCSRS